MGFTETMTLAFVFCKLAGLLELPWWLILLPEFMAAIFYVFLFASVMGHIPTKRKQRKRRD